MSKLQSAIKEINKIDYMASQDQWLNNIHPLVKLCLTMIYIVIVVSFNKYDLVNVASLVVYPFLMFQIGNLSFKESLYRLKIILPIVCIVGVFNPFFDKQTVIIFDSIEMSAGVISMLTLMLKGVFTVLASYILVATTTIEKICYSMRMLHIPKIFVTEIMLIYRYITLLLTQAHTMTDAYSLRAPGQKGVQYKVWGSFVGQLILSSVDRADNVFQAMNLRGYNGEFYCDKITINKKDIVFFVLWFVVLIVFRAFNVLEFIGSIFI